MSEPVNVRDDRKHTFFIVDNALIEKHGRTIGPYGIAVYSALAMHANGARRCSPSVTSIANEIGACPRQVRAKMRQLAELGLLTIEAPPAKGAKSPTNTYVLKDAETTPACSATPAYSAALTKACDATVAPDAALTPAPHATPARRAARPSPPTRVVSPPPSGETKDQEHQSSGAKAPSDCSAAKPPKAARARPPRKVGLLYGDLFVAVRTACRLGNGSLGKVDGRLVSNAAKDLETTGATPADVEAAARRWYVEDWRGKKHQAPTPSQLVTWVTQCRATSAGSSAPTHPADDGSEDLAAWGEIFVEHAALTDKEYRR